MELVQQAFPVFLLIFCRITSFFVVAPVLSTRGVPPTFKIGLGFFVSLLVYLTYGASESVDTGAAYLLLIVREVLAGLLLGFVAYLFFSVVQTAGAFIDLQMGFGMANIIDPVTGTSAPMMGNFKYMLLTLIFLSLNGHHYLLSALMRSYEWIPLDNRLFARMADGSAADFLARAFSETFLLALQLSAPIVVAMFLTDVGLGFLAKTAPQYNVFVIGMPIKILVGFLILILLIPGFTALFGSLFADMFEALESLLNLLSRSASTG